METDITEIFQQKKDMIEMFYMLYAVICTIVIVLMVILSNYMTASIRILMVSTKRIADGEYETAVAPVQDQEFQELAKSFESMRLAVMTQMESLKHELQCKDDFIANFSHELKTPLTSIVGFAETMMIQELQQTQQQAALSYIVHEGERLERLSYKMMDLMMLNRSIALTLTHMKPFLQQLTEQISMILSPYDISFQLEAGDAQIEIEPDLFTTMLLNLIDNSRKADATSIKLYAHCSEDMYEIRCIDNGRGIPEHALANVKDAFYMVDTSRASSKHGAGLGLALCERIASLHHMTLTLTSTLGEGTTAIILWKPPYK